MKILMIGLGSIGQRHLRNIKLLYGNEHEIIAYRVRGQQTTFSKDMKIREGISLEEEFNIKSFYNLEKALQEKPDIAFITNITSEHIKCAIKCAEARCDLFIEKPLGVDLIEIDKLKSLIKANKLVSFVGFQNRYHPVLQELKKHLTYKKLGTIISVDIEMGERLETMHSYEDYSTTYMAQKSMGGGVILNQEIHELDYLQWLFGKPESVYSVGGKGSSLNIDVEDNCSSIFIINNNGRQYPVYTHADFFQSPPVRRCKVIFEHGTIEADLLKAMCTIKQHNKKIEIKQFKEFDRNKLFIDELKDFMYAVATRCISAIPLEEGIISMEMALASKESYKYSKPVIIEGLTQG